MVERLSLADLLAVMLALSLAVSLAVLEAVMELDRDAVFDAVSLGVSLLDSDAPMKRLHRHRRVLVHSSTALVSEL